MIYQVVVGGIDGVKITIDLCDNEKEMQRITVAELKDKIFEKFLGITECPELMFGNMTLNDDRKKLVDYGVVHMSKINMVLNTVDAGKPELDFTADGMGDKEDETRKRRENIRLIFTGKQLGGETSLLSEYGVQHLSVIQLVLKVPGRGGPPPLQLHTDYRLAAAKDLQHQRMGKIYQVVVCGLRGKKLMIDLCNTEEQMQRFTVGQLKKKIFEKLNYTAGRENIRLIFIDRQLEGDTSLLSEYGVQNKSVIQLVIKVPGGGPFFPPHPHTDDGLGDKEGETRRSKECLNISMSKTQDKFSVGPK